MVRLENNIDFATVGVQGYSIITDEEALPRDDDYNDFFQVVIEEDFIKFCLTFDKETSLKCLISCGCEELLDKMYEEGTRYWIIIEKEELLDSYPQILI